MRVRERTEQLLGSILADATTNWKEKAADFAATETELADKLTMTKNPAPLAHVDTKNMAGLVQSLGALVEQEPRNAKGLESSGI